MARKGRKRVIIKAGQTVRVGNELCTCSTDPWNANAVCGLIRVCKRLKERNVTTNLLNSQFQKQQGY